jgi:hypothetical protein
MQVAVLAGLLTINACSKKQDSPTPKEQPTMSVASKIYESNYNPGSAEKGLAEVKNFIEYTKFAAKKKRTTFPDISVDGGSWLAEGGANFLRNMNRGAAYKSQQSFEITVSKTNETTINGESLTNEFESLMGEIEAYEVSSGHTANTINGYVIENNTLDVTMKFDVVYGEVLPDPSEYVYPTNDTLYCGAANLLTTGITNHYFVPGIVLMGVVTYTPLIGYSASPFDSARLWQSNVTNTFSASQFPIYHTGAIEIADNYIATTHPCPSTAVCPTIVGASMTCQYGTVTTVLYSHALYTVTTAMFAGAY